MSDQMWAREKARDFLLGPILGLYVSWDRWQWSDALTR